MTPYITSMLKTVSDYKGSFKKLKSVPRYTTHQFLMYIVIWIVGKHLLRKQIQNYGSNSQKRLFGLYLCLHKFLLASSPFAWCLASFHNHAAKSEASFNSWKICRTSWSKVGATAATQNEKWCCYPRVIQLGLAEISLWPCWGEIWWQAGILWPRVNLLEQDELLD